MHRMAGEVQAAISIPLIHIGEATAEAVKRAGLRTVGLVGTRYTMEMDFYPKKLAAHGIETLIPPDEERGIVHSIIYSELAKGIFKDETKQQLQRINAGLVARGAEGVILGCTEIPILIKQSDSSVPVFDTTDIHAHAAVAFAVQGEAAVLTPEENQR
jgi:aspartate racemase